MIKRYMSHADYLARPETSNSDLGDFKRAPAFFRYRKDNPEEKEAGAIPPPASQAVFDIGTAFHMRVLEPDLYTKRVLELPPINFRSKSGAETWEDISSIHEGKLFLRNESAQIVNGMAESVLKTPACKDFLDAKGKTELSVFREINDNDGNPIKCRCRIDKAFDAVPFLGDVKTAIDASPEGFEKAIWNYSYYRQAGMYSDLYAQATGQELKAFLFLVVEKKPPHLSAVYQLDSSVITEGIIEYRELATRMNRCLKTNDFPGYGNGELTELTLPDWAFKKLSV